MKTDCPNPRSWKCRWFAKYRIEENWEGNSYVYKKFTLFDPGFKRCAGKSTPKVTLSMAYNREPGLLAVAVAKMELMIFSFESISTAPKLLRVHPLEKAKEVVSIHRYFPHEPCINLMWNGDILGCHCLMQERNNSPDPRDCYSLPSSAIADGAVHYFYGWNSKKLLWKHTWDSPDKKTPLCSTPWGFIISGFFGKKQHPELRLYNTGGKYPFIPT
ncbi:hypothetical protein Pelo_8064 [Pelomyxa schiedti]|nr:hypothetical protein Pelo_8064 [Pelomyxa schiedti]